MHSSRLCKGQLVSGGHHRGRLPRILFNPLHVIGDTLQLHNKSPMHPVAPTCTVFVAAVAVLAYFVVPPLIWHTVYDGEVVAVFDEGGLVLHPRHTHNTSNTEPLP